MFSIFLKLKYLLHLITKEEYKKHKVVHIIRSSAFFNKDWYISQYPDIAKSGIDPARHYALTGWQEGRNPCFSFNSKKYLAQNEDVAKAHINPLYHYETIGKYEGRSFPIEEELTSAFGKMFPPARPSLFSLFKKSFIFPVPQTYSYTHYKGFSYYPTRFLKKAFSRVCCVSDTNALMPSVCTKVPPQDLDIIKDPYIFTPLEKENPQNPLKPFISIIVTSYNYASFIEKTLNSLINQTYRNREIIVIDDASEDNSVEIIKAYCKKHPFIKFYQHTQNKGLIKALLLGIKKAKGDYIAFCESDDYWDKTHLSDIVDIINKDKKAFFITAKVKTIGTVSPQMKSHKKITIQGLFHKAGKIICNPLLLNHNPIPTFSCVCIKKDLLKKLNFSSPVPAWLDWWLWRQVLSIQPVYFTNKETVFWRIHNSYNSATNAQKRMLFYDDFVLSSNIFISKRKPKLSKKMLKIKPFIDEKYYHKLYPYTKFIPASYHYMTKGFLQGCNPSPYFDTNGYLSLYPDVKRTNINPLYHYIMNGKKEGRTSIPVTQKPIIYKAPLIQGQKRVLLITHLLNYTGAPILLFNIALLLKSKGYNVVVLSPKAGALGDAFIKNKITLIIDPAPFVKKEAFDYYKNYDFKLALCNTYCNINIYTLIKDKIPSFLWIHDIIKKEDVTEYLPSLKNDKNIYVPSKLTKEKIQTFLLHPKILSYPVKDVVENDSISIDGTKEKITIALCGTIQERKGQDIFIKAIKRLPQDIRKKASFIIMGEVCDEAYQKELLKEASGISEITFKKPIKNFKAYHRFLDKIDILCMPSRADPYPLVVIDALMHKKIPVVSDMVGQADIITHGKNGFIFKNEDDKALSDIFLSLLTTPIAPSLSRETRKLFKSYFNEDIWFQEFEKIFQTLTRKK